MFRRPARHSNQVGVSLITTVMKPALMTLVRDLHHAVHVMVSNNDELWRMWFCVCWMFVHTTVRCMPSLWVVYCSQIYLHPVYELYTVRTQSTSYISYPVYELYMYARMLPRLRCEFFCCRYACKMADTNIEMNQIAHDSLACRLRGYGPVWLLCELHAVMPQ